MSPLFGFFSAKKALSMGVSNYLTKPIVAEELNDSMLRILEEMEEKKKESFEKFSKSFWGSKGSFFKKTPWSPKAFISMILPRYDLLKLCDIHNEHAVAAQSAFDDVDGVHNGRMVAIEHAADVGEGHVGQVAE